MYLLLLLQGSAQVSPCVFGGWNASFGRSTQTECWDPSVRQWVLQPGYDLPLAIDRAAVIDIGGLPCLIGGVSNGSNIGLYEMWCLNFSNPASPWAMGPDLPFGISTISTGPYSSSNNPTVPGRGGTQMTVAGKPVAVGGSPGADAYNGNSGGFVWNSVPGNTLGGSWTNLGPQMALARSQASSFIYNGSICVGAGVSNGEPNRVYLSTSECISSTTGVWSPGPTLNVARSGAASFLANGWWCVIGGGQELNEYTVVTMECLMPNSNGGHLLPPAPAPTYTYTPYTWQTTGYNSAQGATWVGATVFNLDGLPCLGDSKDVNVYCLNATLDPSSWVAYPSRAIERMWAAVIYYDHITPTTSPTRSPTRSPVTNSPTRSPTSSPTLSPTASPTRSPTLGPTASPTRSPTTLSPTASPTRSPTLSPTLGPSLSPTRSPTLGPSLSPTHSPTLGPTSSPASNPTSSPSLTGAPTNAPTAAPTINPTTSPTIAVGTWGVDYPRSFLTSQYTSFTVTPQSFVANAASPPLWIFSNGLTLSGSPLVVAPWNFTAGLNYSFYSQIDGVNTQTCSFSVLSAPLSVVVQGGNQNVATYSTVILDASQSTDPDLPPSSNSLTFAWSLVGCAHATVPSNSYTSSRLIITTDAADPSCSAQLTVSSPGKSAGVTVALPVTSLLISNVSISGSQLIAASNVLRLLVDATNVAQLTRFAWGVIPSIPSQNGRCAFPSVTSSDSRALSLPPGCLTAGMTYRFNFTVGNSNGAAVAWHSVDVIALPAGGSCEISPPNGVAASTVFEIICADWGQPGSIPVSLQYSLVIPGSTVLLSPPQSQSTLQVILPDSISGTALAVRIVGYQDVFTDFLLPINVTVTRATSCPLSSLQSDSTLQSFTVAFLEYRDNPTAAKLCSTQLVHQLWDEFWAQLQSAMASVVQDPDFLVLGFEAAISTAPAGSAKADSLLQVISDFINNDPDTTVVMTILALQPAMEKLIGPANCTAQDLLDSLLSQLVRASTSGDIPSDPALVYSGSTLSVTSNYYFADGGDVDIAANGVSANVPSSLIAQSGGNVAALTITEYSDKNNLCRTAKDGSLVASGTVVDITLSTKDGQAIAVQLPNGNFQFVIPLSDTQRCGKVACQWWNPATKEWTGSGCTGQPVANDPSSYLCTCTHLTEFALLLNPVVCPTYRNAYLTLMVLYIVVGFITIIKIAERIHAHRQHRKRASGPTVVWQHAMIAGLTAARAVACGTLASPSFSRSWTLPARAVALVLPYLLVFWIYTLMVFQWASVLHYGMKFKGDAFSQVRWIFLLYNLGVCAAMVAMLVELGLASEAVKTQVAIGATATLAVITFLTAASFLTYSMLLYRVMKDGGRNSQPSSGPRSPSGASNSNPLSSTNSLSSSRRTSRRCCPEDVKSKIFFSGLAVSILLCLQAAMHVMSVTTQRVGPVGSPNGETSADPSEIVVLCSDWLSLVVLLAMYHKAMSSDSQAELKRGQKSGRFESMKQEVEFSTKERAETK